MVKEATGSMDQASQVRAGAEPAPAEAARYSQAG